MRADPGSRPAARLKTEGSSPRSTRPAPATARSTASARPGRNCAVVMSLSAAIGSRGDAYGNAMAEAWVASFKSELVDGRRFPSYEHAEHETLNWIGFYNEERLHEELDDLPPAEYEELNIKKDNTTILSTK